MTRTDNVKAGFDPSCKQTREVNKNCSKDKKQKKQDKSKYSQCLCSQQQQKNMFVTNILDKNE